MKITIIAIRRTVIEIPGVGIGIVQSEFPMEIELPNNNDEKNKGAHDSPVQQIIAAQLERN